MSYLETERIVLRDITSADATLLLELDSDPDVMTCLTNGKPSTLAETNAAIIRIKDLAQKHNNQFGVWIAIEKSSGSFIGWFLFRPCIKFPDDIKTIEIGTA